MEATSYSKYHKNYYIKHKDEIKQRQAIYQKEYYKKNRERILTRVKEYQKAKLEAIEEAPESPATE